jgi:hypothetical protein
MKAQFYDPYGVYPLNLAAHGLRLDDDNFWPSSGPLRTTVNQGQVSVIPAAELRSPGTRQREYKKCCGAPTARPVHDTGA